MAHTKLNTFHLFAGAGGGILGDLLLGHNPIGACEIEPYPRDVLLARQRDGILPTFPIWDDVAHSTEIPGADQLTFFAGDSPALTSVQLGQTIMSTERSEDLTEKSRGCGQRWLGVAGEMRPKFVFIENSPNLRAKGLSRVLNDIRNLGYYARWCVLGSKDIGADHHRKRIWILAYTDQPQLKRGGVSSRVYTQDSDAIGSNRRKDQSSVERVADGLASGLDKNWGKRLKAIGNGQDSAVAASAFNILSEGLI